MNNLSRINWRRGWDLNPRYGFPYARFRGECFQPLSHLSAVGEARLADELADRQRCVMLRVSIRNPSSLEKHFMSTSIAACAMWRKARMSDASVRTAVLPAPIVPVIISRDSVAAPLLRKSCGNSAARREKLLQKPRTLRRQNPCGDLDLVIQLRMCQHFETRAHCAAFGIIRAIH